LNLDVQQLKADFFKTLAPPLRINILELLTAAKQIFNNHLVDTISMLDRINKQPDGYRLFVYDYVSTF
jgi:hypothetical protein